MIAAYSFGVICGVFLVVIIAIFYVGKGWDD